MTNLLKPLLIGEKPLSLREIAEVSLHERKVSLSPRQKETLKRERTWLETQLREAKNPIYGVNTGFGALSDQIISEDQLSQLQVNLLRSHCTGVGEAFSTAEVRAILLLRAHTLALGYSGIRPETVELLVELLNRGVHPLIPKRGSVGASGDLAPLAHLALVLIGEGEAECGGRVSFARDALSRGGLQPIVLFPKEGLSLINGTQVMTALGALALLDAHRLLLVADLAAALSNEALRGSRGPFDPSLHRVRPHRGQQISADRLFRLTEGSPIAQSHENCKRVQDPYSFRCAPQVHGAAYDLLSFVKNQIETEMNSVTDNPILFMDENKILSGGNFHGEPVARALDCAAIALSELGSISERRVDKLLNPHFSQLPPFLAKDAGLHSGLMMVQVSAAALASENKVLAHPASVDSIPTSNDKEDHVSMGLTSALKLQQIIRNVEYILAIELLTARQALEFVLPLETADPLRNIVDTLREKVAFVASDRPLSRDIEALREMIRKDTLIDLLESSFGEMRGLLK